MLEKYSGTADLKHYSLQELNVLATDIRQKIIATVAANGGHLAASLGVVELAIALHTALDTPKDKIIWDVGHQTYAHKILTGRLDKIATIRKSGGLSGFPRREESVYDPLTVGHASTSVSAAVGLARARDIKKENQAIFSVVGDGSFSGGMIFEALNNAQQLKNFVVILNDNDMAISKPVGTLSKMITNLRLSNFYQASKKNIESMIALIPRIGKPLAKAADKLINRTGRLIINELAKKQRAGFFQDMGFTYFGPLDGHNIALLVAAVKQAKNYPRPVLLHILTRKGKGYAPAENEPSHFHGVSGFDPETGTLKNPAKKSYTQIFGEELLKQAAAEPKLCAITAAMADGTGLNNFAACYPERFFDVGIAEEHAVTFAGGLAAAGLKPVVALYSTFLQRAYDQILHDVALQKLPVFFAIDRAGLVGEDGPTHHGVFDLSFLRTVPDLIIAVPKDGNELKDLIKLGLSLDQNFAVRYPRGPALFCEPEREAENITLGQAEIVYGSAKAQTVIWAVGTMVKQALLAVSKSQDVCIVNARFVHPLDKKLLAETLQGAQRLITIEENTVRGGFGAAVAEALTELNISVPQTMLGVPPHFIEYGTVEQLYKICGLDVESLSKVF